MRIAVYGGSFNPPHLGHVRAARAALEQLRPDRLLLIPAAEPPHKTLAAGSPDGAARAAMTELAFRELPGAEVSDMELRRAGPSYTADTLSELAALYPGAELILLMGTDMLLTLEQWYDYRRILSLAAVAAFARNPGGEEALRAQAARLRETYGARVELVSCAPFPVSSTQVRALLPLRRGRDFLSDAVYGEIIRRRYYGAAPDFVWLREKSYAWLKPKRIPHVQGCEEEAVRLAKRWGADEQLAAEAGILHDITKKFVLNEQLNLCRKYDIVNDTVEEANTKLLHAKTGAAVARDLFGVGDAVYGAIRWHTTGRPEMTLLERIVYMADYIEPNRSFAGLDRLRELAYSDLDQAMILGLRMSLEDLRSGGITPHPITTAALEWFRRKQDR